MLSAPFHRPARARWLPDALVALLVLHCGCRAAPPAAEVDAPFGSVRADTLTEARAVEHVARNLIPEVRGRLGESLDRTIDIWVQHQLEIWSGEPFAAHVAGMSDFNAGRIHVRQGDPNLRLHLAHELVHVLAGPVWRELPGVLEEGLCDRIAVELVPELGMDHHVKRLVEAAAPVGGVRALVAVRGPPAPQRLRIQAEVRLLLQDVSSITLTEALELPSKQVFDRATSDAGVGLYGLGYLVADRIVERTGYDGLRELCARARRQGRKQLAAAEVLRAAGLVDRPSAIQNAVDEALGEKELRTLASLLAQDLADAVLQFGRPLHQGVDVDEFLRSAEPEFGLPHVDTRLRLADVPAFRAAVEAAFEGGP